MRLGGISWNIPVKASVYHAQIAQGRYKKLPGKPVGIIEIQPIETKNNYNPLVLTFTVSPYRNFKRVLLQSQRKERPSRYAKSLFESCFKNW